MKKQPDPEPDLPVPGGGAPGDSDSGTPDPPGPDELERLLSRLVDDDLDEPGWERLQAILRSGVEARRRYVRFLALDAGLEDALVAPGLTPADFGSAMNDAGSPGSAEASAAPGIGGAAAVHLDDAPAGRPAEDATGSSGREAVPSPGRRVISYALVAAAAAGVAAVFTLAFGPGRTLNPPPSPPGPDLAAAESPAGESAITAAAAGSGLFARENLALLTQTKEAIWAGDAPVRSEGETLQAGTLRLRSGRVRVEFLNGATVELQGPARFELISSDRAYLHHGRIAAKVPPEASGFTVGTAGAAVVDLGTEFAVNAHRGGASEVHVFDGEVEVWTLEGGLPQASSSLLSAESAVITGGGGEVVHRPLEPDQFIRVTAPRSTPLPVTPSYVEAVLAAGPLAYWRFGDAAPGGDVASEVPEGPVLRLEGAVELAGDETNRVAYFDADAGGGALLAEEPFAEINTGDYTLEAWVYPESHAPAALISLVKPRVRGAPRGGINRLCSIDLRKPPRSFAHQLGTVRFVHRRQAAAGGGGRNVFSKVGYTPGQWHHVVAVKTDAGLALYLDGELAMKARVAGLSGPGAYLLAAGRAGPSPKGRPLAGALDEVAVYPRALSEEEIRRHFDLIAPPRPPR